jgi:hypothetical protein
MLLFMPLPVAFVGELKSPLIAHKRLYALVRPQMLLEQGLTQEGLVAKKALEGSLSLVIVLPHMVI